MWMDAKGGDRDLASLRVALGECHFSIHPAQWPSIRQQWWQCNLSRMVMLTQGSPSICKLGDGNEGRLGSLKSEWAAKSKDDLSSLPLPHSVCPGKSNRGGRRLYTEECERGERGMSGRPPSSVGLLRPYLAKKNPLRIRQEFGFLQNVSQSPTIAEKQG